METLCQTEGGTQSLKDHVAKAKECLKGSVIPLGLWSDATPMNWDRSESLELTLVNLPGLPKDSGSTSWRFQCAAISHKNVAKGLTSNQIFEVLSWSFQQLFVGRMPCSRHDGKPFTATQCSVFSEFCSCFGQLVCFQVFGVEFVLVSRLGKVHSLFFSSQGEMENQAQLPKSWMLWSTGRDARRLEVFC